MKLKGKILALSLVPVILLGVTMFLVAADRIANGIYDEAYLELDQAAQNISESCNHQTEDSVQTSQNVVEMKDGMNVFSV